MPNTIEKSKKYLDMVTELYRKDSLTADLETKVVKFDPSNANIVNMLEITTQGLGDYVRDTGYPTASVNSVWKPYQLTQDRGVRFPLDRADAEETLGMTIGAIAGDFTKEWLKPELDLYRFVKFGATPKATGALTSNNILAAIDAASQSLSDAEVDDNGQRILFVNQSLESILKAALPRQWTNESEVSTKVLKYNGMELRFVPSARFKTGITLNPGTSNSFGYAATGDPINFIMLDPSAVWQVTRFENSKFIDANENQNMDSHLFMYRIIHDCGIIARKANGIYAHVNS
jgi:hypothetical protein